MTDLNALWREILGDDPLLARRPRFRFDPDHYAQADPNLDTDLEALRAHYRDHGKAEGRFPNRFQELKATHPGIGLRVRRLITDPRLLAALEEAPAGATELAFELMRLEHDAHISNFSAAYYRKANPDVAKAGVPPLEHFLIHGIRERRRSLGLLRQNEHVGAQEFDPSLPTCLVALHELSNTGAPHVGLDLALEGARTHNIVVAALRGGALLDRFLATSCSVLITADPYADLDYFVSEALKHIDVAICNSVETAPFIRLLVARDIPFVSYIHEYASYTFPTYKTIHTSLFADVLAFTSEHVRDSWGSVLTDVEFDVDHDSVVIPQRPVVEGAVSAKSHTDARERLSKMIGRDCTDLRIVCGAGHVQWRKGTDIFAMTAQIARHRDPDTIFVWVGDGLNHEDTYFGAWMTHHLEQAGAGDPTRNLFMLPAGDHYRDVLRASDAMLLTSRLDPLPNVVFDGLEEGCHVVLFDGASGFTDPGYLETEHLHLVEYANPDAAATAVLTLPTKQSHEDVDAEATGNPLTGVFERLLGEIAQGTRRRRRLVMGPTGMDEPILYSGAPADRHLRTREREKLFTLQRRFLWRDEADAAETLARSQNWVHRACSVATYSTAETSSLPEYTIHVHAFYVKELPAELDAHLAFRTASRIVITTDSAEKRKSIEAALAARELPGEVLVVPNKGRDILPFLELFRPGGPGGGGEIWGHFHQKKSIGSTVGGDLWRKFMTSILLGSADQVSSAIQAAGRPDVGLVAPLDPHVGQWNASRMLLPRFEESVAGPLPDNPLAFPMGNMFWVKSDVVQAMNTLFPPDYAWPNEPIPNDGTEFHLIERLWPVMAAQCGLSSVFVSKADQRRRL